MRIYEAKKELCEICKVNQGVVMPYCCDGEREFFMLTCKECVDKVPYQVIPIERTLGEGYFYCPDMPENFEGMMDSIDVEKFDATKPILTKYGKKLLNKKAPQ